MRCFKCRKISGVILLIIFNIFLVACNDSQTKEAFPTIKKITNADVIPTVTFKMPSPVVKIPEDEAPHNVTAEWWYYTGHIETVDGERYGLIYVLFQFIHNDLPVQIMADFGVQDVKRKKFKYDEIIKLIDQKDFKFGGTDGFNFDTGGWKLSGKNGLDRLQAKMKDGSYSINLTMKDIKGLALPGGGLINYGKRVPWLSFYYERPRMTVTGAITVGNEVKPIKTGEIWFDHQWGNFYIASAWKWFSAQLDDGSELMFYKLYTLENELFQTFGFYMPPCQNTCKPNEFIETIDFSKQGFTNESKDVWKSPKTGINYPINWRVIIKGNEKMPSFDLTFTPVTLDAEILLNGKKETVYWEGDNYIQGTKDGKPISGSGFVELSGYGRGVKID